jgi:hypothetical protein
MEDWASAEILIGFNGDESLISNPNRFPNCPIREFQKRIHSGVAWSSWDSGRNAYSTSFSTTVEEFIWKKLELVEDARDSTAATTEPPGAGEDAHH